MTSIHESHNRPTNLVGYRSTMRILKKHLQNHVSSLQALWGQVYLKIPLAISWHMVVPTVLEETNQKDNLLSKLKVVNSLVHKLPVRE